MTFETLFDRHDWKPIRDCPGRFSLPDFDPAAAHSLEQLLERARIQHFENANCPDTVLVAELANGAAVISYLRPDGNLLHTLNTPEGFQRKIDQLGIHLKERPDA